jgi:hypothetical protein
MAPAAVRRPGSRPPARAGVLLLVALVCLLLHALCAPGPPSSLADRDEAPVAAPEVPGGDSHDHPEPMSRRRGTQAGSLPRIPAPAPAVGEVLTGTVPGLSRLPAPRRPPSPLRTVLRC